MVHAIYLSVAYICEAVLYFRRDFLNDTACDLQRVLAVTGTQM